MANPAQSPELKRTCPSCGRAVRPGFKFCEFCGVKLPELGTCSNCGTQFIAPVKVCHLCGAPVVLEAKPEPGGVEEELAEMVSGPVEEMVSEPEEPEDAYVEEDDARDVDASRDAADESLEYFIEKAAPARSAGGIQEPDTEELLEKYGKEYNDNEMLGSIKRTLFPFRKKSRATKGPMDHSATKPSGAVDDALHLADKKAVPVRRPVNRMRILVGAVIVAVFITTIYIIGLPLFTTGPTLPGPTQPEPTLTASLTPAPTVLPTTVQGAFTTQPTQRPPSALPFNFLVQKDIMDARITVTFAGSTTSSKAGIRTADVTVTHPGGSVATGILMPLKGITEITLDGSKDTDRVVIIAEMNSGETYRVYDRLIPYMGI